MDYCVIRYQTPQTTPERVRSLAQRNERDQRVLESPEHHRTPHHVRIARLGVFGASIPPPVFMPASTVAPPAPVYTHLPAHLAQQYAALPPLQTRRQASVAPVHPPQLAPAFVPAPSRYHHLPANLAQQLAALPPLIPLGRGRGRDRGIGNSVIAPAPLPFSEIAAQYAALPSVRFILFVTLSEANWVHHL